MIEVTYYYSACVGIWTHETSILCDPWFTDGAFDGSWYLYPKPQAPLDTIPEYAFVFISHIHPDHYDPTFLRAYLAKWPASKVIIAKRPNNYLSFRMRTDGIAHELVEEVEVGSTSLRVFPDSRTVLSIDCALVVKRGDHSVVNMNDSLYDDAQVSAIRDYCGDQPTIGLLAYTGAGPYPQTYDMEPALLVRRAEEKKQQFFERYKKMREALNPQVTIPFAGQYLLGGRLHELNPYRGTADAVEVTRFDRTAVVLREHGEGTINTENLRAEGVRTVPYDIDAMNSYAASLADRPMDYERYFGDTPAVVLPLGRLLPKAYARAITKSLCTVDHYLCIRLGDQWFVANARAGSDECGIKERVDDKEPRSEILMDARYLFGLLTGVFHWNNAEVGSQFRVRRVPDEFNDAARKFLTFMQV